MLQLAIISVELFAVRIKKTPKSSCSRERHRKAKDSIHFQASGKICGESVHLRVNPFVETNRKSIYHFTVEFQIIQLSFSTKQVPAILHNESRQTAYIYITLGLSHLALWSLKEIRLELLRIYISTLKRTQPIKFLLFAFTILFPT